MGRATIVENLGGGRYKIRKDAGQSRANAEISSLQSKLLEIEQQIIAILNQQTQLDSQLIQARSAYDQATNEYVSALQGDQNASTQAWEKASENLTTIQLLLAENNRELQLTQADKASITRRINYLQSLDLVKDIDTWSFDYNDNATGEVATIEIPGEPKYTLIAPGARAPTEADGQVLAREVMTGPQAYFNAAILPGWQKFKPTYRRGIITSVDNVNNLANVNLINDLSSAQSLNINQQSTLENVPIVYVCESSTFVVGDECLIEFLNQNWNTPRIIACGPLSLNQAEFLSGQNYADGRITFDANAKKIVFVYRRPNLGGIAVVGTLNGTSIDFGTPIIFSNISTFITTINYDPDTKKILITYNTTDTSSGATAYLVSAIVGEVIDNSINFGSPVIFQDSRTPGFEGTAFKRSIVYDNNSQKFVIFYEVSLFQGAVSRYLYATIGTITGTSISFTSPVEFANHGANSLNQYWLNNPVYDPNNKKILLCYLEYRFQEDAFAALARVVTVNGNSISFGPLVEFGRTTLLDYNYLLNNTNTATPLSVYEPNIQKIIVLYNNAENNDYITFAFAEINNNSINFEIVSVPDWGKSRDTAVHSIAYNPNSQKIVILYSDGLNNSFPTTITATINNNSIDFESPIVLANEYYVKLVYAFSGLVYESHDKKMVGIYSSTLDPNNSNFPPTDNHSYFILGGASPSTHVFFE